MPHDLKHTIDTILQQSVQATDGSPSLPGVVAMVTDRHGNLYEGAAGVRALDTGTPMSTDSVMALFSTTKAITGTALMQLVEEGRVRLSDPAKAFVPEIAEIQVLEGFDADGLPRTRAPKRDITLNDLMLHLSGFSYEFLSADDLAYRRARQIPPVSSNRFESVRTVLLHDPGERWTYGVGIDWVGRIVEALRGQRLGEVMRERIFEPLGMIDVGFEPDEAMRARRATIHTRASDGRLTPMPERARTQAPAMQMGGHGLHGTVSEYMKFIRMLLNDGMGPLGRVLQPDTVATMARNGLPASLRSGGWVSSVPMLANSGEYLPGVPKSWAYTFQVNEADAPTGRPAGSLMWSGLANLFYWIDRRHGIGGFWATQILPFHDAASHAGFTAFETAVYRSLKG